MDDLISRQAAIDALAEDMPSTYTPDGSHPADEGILMVQEIYADCIQTLKELPSAQPDYQEVLGWLLAYHTMSFDLHGRYLPHEVISWLINDFTEEFIAERGQNG